MCKDGSGQQSHAPSITNSTGTLITPKNVPELQLVDANNLQSGEFILLGATHCHA